MPGSGFSPPASIYPRFPIFLSLLQQFPPKLKPARSWVAIWPAFQPHHTKEGEVGLPFCHHFLPPPPLKGPGYREYRQKRSVIGPQSYPVIAIYLSIILNIARRSQRLTGPYLSTATHQRNNGMNQQITCCKYVTCRCSMPVQMCVYPTQLYHWHCQPDQCPQQ